MKRGGSSAGPESLVLIDYHIITGACQILKRWVLDKGEQGKGVEKLLSWTRVELEVASTFGAPGPDRDRKSLCGSGPSAKRKKKSGSALGKSKALVEKQTLTVYDSAESIAELRGFANRLQNKRTASHSRRLDRVDC